MYDLIFDSLVLKKKKKKRGQMAKRHIMQERISTVGLADPPNDHYRSWPTYYVLL